ncbi:tyrosine-type recombinase/integrase [Actinomadura geliboluensis]|uniref:tyrosine-type recombinase/integrase n=1 Tax=Actinomadura geliboluensis TaxID=882440 RepID=UPI003722B4BD
MDEYAQPGPKGFVFVGVRGGQLRRSNFSEVWARALEKAELEVGAIHVHDLRHTGNTYAAVSGASLAELMNRMGHSSTRAAQVYLHARQDRDREIASSLGRWPRGNSRRARRTRTRSGASPRDRARWLMNERGPESVVTHWPGPSSWERVTGIEPALSAWE